MVANPETRAAPDPMSAFFHATSDLLERIDRIRARRPSPGGWVIPEIDAEGRLTDLYVAPGTIARLTNEELTAEIMAAVRESTADAGRQHAVAMQDAAAEIRRTFEEPRADVADDDDTGR